MAIETQKLIHQLDDGRLEGRIAKQLRIAVVIPCYRECRHILDVLARIPPEVVQIICVDDGCPDQTGVFVEENNTDPRIAVIKSERNQGVGGATKRGYLAALATDAEVVVKLDGDGQMDPELIPTLIAPIADGYADYTKGNRFFDSENTASMPLYRIVGNVVMSFVSKFSSGYWQLFDPNNGFTAIHHAVLRLMPLEKISDDYFFESDMLYQLNILRAVVADVPMEAIYGDETSSLNIFKILMPFARNHLMNFLRRIFYTYFLRDFNIASLELILGIISN